MTTLEIPAYTKTRVALAWHACMASETNVPVLNNDLDLVLSCSGGPLLPCTGTITSNSVVSEVEMIERAACPYQRSCSVKIRVKNGDPLDNCTMTVPDGAGGTDVIVKTTERVGVAWSFHD